jgi:hypothetical protein
LNIGYRMGGWMDFFFNFHFAPGVFWGGTYQEIFIRWFYFLLLHNLLAWNHIISKSSLLASFRGSYFIFSRFHHSCELSRVFSIASRRVMVQ